MRILSALAFVLVLVGCGASGPTETADAGGDAAVSDAPVSADAATCARGFVRVSGGRCASYSDANCDGTACRAGTFCTLDGDGTTTSLVCLAP